MGITAILWIYKINCLMFTFWYSWVCQFTVDYCIQLALGACDESSLNKSKVKFYPWGRGASRKFLIIDKKIETLTTGGDLDENFLLS